MKRTAMINATFWIVVSTSVLVGLFMLATGRFLVTAIVGLSACICLVVIGLAKPSGLKARQLASVSQQRRNGLAIMVTGMATIIIGAILTLVWPGPVANFLLLWATPGMTLGGAIVYWHARSQQSKGGDRED